MKKLILLAYGETAPYALRSLAKKFEVMAVVTPPEDAGLYRSEEVLPVEKLAAERKINVVRSDKPGTLKNLILAHKPDAVVISSFNKIIPDEILVLSKFINVHHGDLPRWRGRANINWALIKGRKSIVLAIHEASPDLDSGNIYAQYVIPIAEKDTVKTVYGKFNATIERELAGIIEKVLAGYKGKKQKGKPTYCCTRLPEDGYIEWSKSTRDIYNLIRALTRPFPGAFTYFEGEKMIIWEAEIPKNPKEYEGRVPGRVIGVLKDGVEVLTGDSSIIIKEVEYRGNETSASNIVKSVKKTLGLSLPGIYEILLEKIMDIEKKRKA